MTITWVVGGTSGIGRACAELLEEVPGRRVIATGNEVDVRDPDALFNFFLTNPILVQCEDERITDLIYSVGVNHLEWSQIVDPAVVLDLYHVNVVAPGMTEPTDMQQYVDERVPLIRKWSPDQARKYEESQIPMKRRANVNEVASVVVSTLLMPTPYLNGAIIPVNGGR